MQYSTEKQAITVKIKHAIQRKPNCTLNDLFNGTYEMVYEKVVSQQSVVTI
jgi:hypothetical protein